MSFLRDDPISTFTKQDIDLLRTSLLDVLENKSENETLEWENTNTGAKGKIKLLKISKENGYPCKVVGLQNISKDNMRSAYKYKACKPENTWKVVPLNGG